MIGADISLARVTDEGIIAEDRKGEGFFYPPLDDHQDLFLHEDESYHENGVTVFVFSRMLQSCDFERDEFFEDRDQVGLCLFCFFLSNLSQWIIFAFGDGDFSYHGPNRGSLLIDLFEEQDSVLFILVCFFFFDVILSLELPNLRKKYWSKLQNTLFHHLRRRMLARHTHYLMTRNIMLFNLKPWLDLH